MSWAKGTVDDAGSYVIRYPAIRWRQLRTIFGWAALQHHTLLHTVLAVNLPRDRTLSPSSDGKVYLRFSLKQASFVSFVPRNAIDAEPFVYWYEGDIYAQSPHEPLISLPASHIIDGTLEYDVFISVDHEIRVFGDPQVSSSDDVPISQVQFSVSLVESPELRVGETLVVPDIVDGTAYGDVIGLLVENGDQWNTLSAVQSENEVRIQQYPCGDGSFVLIPMHRRLSSPWR